MVEVQIVGEAVAGESVKVRRELEELISSFKKKEFDIAEMLHKVKKFGYYKPDFDTFADYYRSLDIKERNAQYLERMVDVMEQVGIPREDYEPIGLSRLREITSLDPNGSWTNPKDGTVMPLKDFIVEMVNKGKDLSIDEVKTHVKTLKGFKTDDFIPKTFSWLKETLDLVISPALELAKRHIGSIGRDSDGMAVDASDSKALENICADYLNNPSNNVTGEK